MIFRKSLCHAALIAVAVVFNLQQAFADAYYQEVVRTEEGVDPGQIAENWKAHLEVWKKMGFDPGDTQLRQKIVGKAPFRTYYFHIRAENLSELGTIMERILASPDFQPVSQRWDEIRVITSSGYYQTVE